MLARLSVSPFALLMTVFSATGSSAATSYPMLYTSCGVDHTVNESPSRVVTMTQGVTEFMLAMGLEDKMVGTAYLDDAIWPKYATAYASVPVLHPSNYPTEAQIANVSTDFILGSYRSAFRELSCTTERCRGIFNVTTGPCEGNQSDWPGSSYSTCRPQLHANSIGTWLEPVSCEDSSLRPQGGASEETVYAAIRQIGDVFDVAARAEALVTEIKADFDLAEAVLAKRFGGELKTVWLDCVDCCRVDGVPSGQLYVGAGSGAPNLIMQEAGMTNMFGHVEGSWGCVNVSEFMAADPDLVVVVDAAWDTALEKVEYFYNHSDFCNARFVKNADFITIPFSASTLGPRNGAAALDMGSAALHVINGDPVWDYQVKSGVSFIDAQTLSDDTAHLRCPLNLDNVAYTAAVPPPSAPPPPPPPMPPIEKNDLPGWGIGLVTVASLAFLSVVAFVSYMYNRERQGKPIFKPFLEKVEKEKQEKDGSNL